jgi:hypothetical protein
MTLNPLDISGKALRYAAARQSASGEGTYRLEIATNTNASDRRCRVGVAAETPVRLIGQNSVAV